VDVDVEQEIVIFNFKQNADWSGWNEAGPAPV